MSDLPNHDHDPDPAALDELRRAFADDAEDVGDVGDVGDVDTGVQDIDEPDIDEPDIDEPDAPDEHVEWGEPDELDGLDELDEPDEHVERGEPDELDGLDELDEPDEQPVEVVIVEQDPGPAPTEPERPRTIRIDDYAGSTEIDDPPVTPEFVTGDVSHPAVTPEYVTGDVSDPAVTPEFVSRDVPDTATDADTPIGAPPPGTPPNVIAISDDELPDAVYVEGSLDADGSGSIVFIEDDESGDVLGPESERDLRRGIEPRMRERRVAVKRAQSRRRLKRLGIVAGLLLLVVAVLAVLGSPLFAVREGDVEVVGARYTDEERLAEIIDGVVGRPVLRVDTGAIEDEIEAIPWVDAAEVRTDFPHGLLIDIRERAAMATFQGPDGQFRVLDREGRVLDVLDMYPFAYVLIGGPDSVDLQPGDFAPQGYAAASELAKNLTGSMRGRVTQIEVTADGSRLVVHLDDGSTVYFGEARDLLAKLVRLESVLANGQECESGLIDVSTADVTRCSVN